MALVKKNILIIVFSTVLISLQLFPYIYLSLNTPKGRIYLGAERYYPDYYAYLFYINQGSKGASSVQNLFTNEPHRDTFVHYEYLIIGKAGSFFNLSPQKSYFISRSILLLIYILVSYLFIGLFTKNKLHKNLILMLSFLYDGFFFLNLNNFYQPPNLINRLTNEPHKYIGMILLLLTIYFLHRKKLFFLSLSSLLIGFIHGTSAIILIATLLLFLFLQFIAFKKNLSVFIQNNLLVFISLFLLPISLVYWEIVYTNNPIWNYIGSWEKYAAQIDIKSPALPALISSLFLLGPLISLCIIGLKKFLSENKKLGLLLFSFSISNFILLFFGYIILNTSKIRYYQTPYLLVLCLIAYYGMIELAKKITKKISLFVLIVTSLLIIPGIPSIVSETNKFIEPYKNSPDISLYPPIKWSQAIFWLENIPKDSVILSLPKAGLIIPAIPGREVVVGDLVSSYNYLQKLPEVKNFYSGKLTPEQAKNYLQKERVNYVFYGLEEKTYGNIDKYSQFLNPVFRNEDATIYKVIN